MSKIGLVIVLVLMVGRNYAQQDYFVLIQADNNQPFYSRLGGDSRSISSSVQGHLILSQLKEGSYTITIGFPKSLFPESKFSFVLQKKDLDFQLKNLGDKGWGLFNQQTHELKMPDEKRGEEAQKHLEGVKKEDAFSRLMAGVVSDTAVMYNTYAMDATLKERPAIATAPPVDTLSIAAQETAPAGTGSATEKASGDKTSGEEAGKDSIIETVRPESNSSGRIVDSSTLNFGQIKDSSVGQVSGIVQTSPPKTSDSSVRSSLPNAGSIVKLSERKTAKGLRLVYADHVKGGQADTIVVIIAMDTGAHVEQRPEENDKSAASPNRTDTSSLLSARTDQPATLSNDTGAPGQTTDVAPPLFRPLDSSQKKTPAKLLVINSDCRNFATDYDVDKLRVKMLENSKEEERITVSHKVFKTKCFTTKQIRALSEMFTSDALKFRFFETAYPFVSDDHFKELTDLLADPVYNSKFRSMTGQQ